jgi:hypothetical protein
MATSDLPTDIRTGLPRYELEEPLEHLQTMLNRRNVDIESLDIRGEGQDRTRMDVQFMGREPKELQIITGIVNGNPEMDIKSNSVRDLNEKFDFDMKNNNPNYIFRDDIQTRDNVNTIRQGNKSFAEARDMFVVPPAINTQQNIFELLQSRQV